MTASTIASGLRERLANSPASIRQRLLVEFIVEQLKEALGAEEDEAGEIHARSRFEELGVDSKRALEFKEFLEQEFQCTLRTTLMFDYPTPEALAAYIVGNLLARDDATAAESAAPLSAAPVDPTGPVEGDIEELMRKKLEKYQT